MTSVSRRSAILSSRYRSACASTAATSSASPRRRTAAMKPCSMKSSARAFAAGSMTRSRASGCGAPSKRTRMAAEDGGENERQDCSGADGSADGMQHRHPGKSQHAEADHGGYAGEEQRDQRASALLVGARHTVEEQRIVGAHCDDQQPSDEMKNQQPLSENPHPPTG